MPEHIREEFSALRPVIDDPHVLFSSFRRSPQYQTAVTARATTLHFPSTGNWNEFISAFEGTDSCVGLFRTYMQSVDFRYNPELPSYDTVKENIAAYRTLVQATSQNERLARNPQEILANDRERALLHTQTAKKLVAAGVAPSQQLARILLSTICNTNQSGRQLTYFEQIRQSLGATPHA